MSVKASSWSQKKLMERQLPDGRNQWDALKPFCGGFFQLQEGRKWRGTISGAPEDLQVATGVGNKSVINMMEHTPVLGDKVRDASGSLIVATLPEHLLPSFNEAFFSQPKVKKVKNVVELPQATVVVVTPAFAPVEAVVNAPAVQAAPVAIVAQPASVVVVEVPPVVPPEPARVEAALTKIIAAVQATPEEQEIKTAVIQEIVDMPTQEEPQIDETNVLAEMLEPANNPVVPVAPEPVVEVAAQAVAEQPKEGLQQRVNNQIILDVMPNYARQMNILSLDEAKAKSFLVVGAGALGSEVVDTLSGMGIEPISSYDHDIVDAVNIPVQKVYELADIGKPKVQALADRVMRKNGIKLQAFHERFEKQPLARVVVSCVDSIAGRRAIFERCKNNPVVEFFIDGRMGKLYGKVYAVNPSDADQIRQYEGTLKDKPGQVAAAGCSQDIILFAPVIIANAMAMAAVHYMIGEPVKWEQHFTMNKVGLFSTVRANDITPGGNDDITPENELISE